METARTGLVALDFDSDRAAPCDAARSRRRPRVGVVALAASVLVAMPRDDPTLVRTSGSAHARSNRCYPLRREAELMGFPTRPGTAARGA